MNWKILLLRGVALCILVLILWNIPWETLFEEDDDEEVQAPITIHTYCEAQLERRML